MKFEFSAGGVVFRKNNHVVEILIGQHSGHHGWVFPKGLIGDENKGESQEETAVREVREETGIMGKILHPLKPTVHWYQWEGEKRKKTVYYFVMEYVSGNTEDHDWEMEQVKWLPSDEVADRLTFTSEKKAWEEAREYIEENVK
jgi:8-oxo-dGTP pyrophosphatase MutT (NUDIX family)